MSLGKLVLDLNMNGGQFSVSLKEATGALARFVMGANRADSSVRRTESGFRALSATIRDTVVTLALARDALRTVAMATVGWQKSILSVNGEMQRSIALMKAFSKETDPIKATAEAMGDVTKLLTKASNAPFSLTAITNSFVKLRVSGIEPIEQGFNAMIDAVAQFGGNDEALKRASVAIQQMAGKGVVSMEELRQQLGEAVPTAIQSMADGLGVTYSKLVKEISQGKVKSEPAIIAMFREMEFSATGAAKNMMDTWGGAVAQLDTEFKKLMLTVGGFQEGYGEGTYMHGMTSGLKSLTEILKDPSIQATAKQFGENLTGIMNSMIESGKTIISYRDGIYDVAKALLTVYAATKAVAIFGAIGTAIASMAAKSGLAAIAIRASMTSIAASAGVAAAGFTAMGVAGTRAAGALAAARGIMGMVGGAASLLTGPLGILTAAIAAGTYAWFEYRRAAQAGIDAMITSKGVGAGLAELTKAQTKIIENNTAIEGLKLEKAYSDGSVKNPLDTMGIAGSFSKSSAENDAEMERLIKENAQLAVSVVQAQANIIAAAGNAEFTVAETAIRAGMDKVNKAYNEGMKQHRERLLQGEKDGTGKTKEFEAESAKKKYELETQWMEAQYNGYTAQRDLLMQEIQEKQETLKDGTKIQLNDDQAKAKSLAVDQLDRAIGELGQRQEGLIQSRKSFLETMMGAGSGKPTKTPFDGLTIFVDGMRKKLATLDAKVDETNPYLAQLAATVESLGGKKLPNFDKVYSEGIKLAEAAWAQEKAKKALTDANKTYTDGMERLDQIQGLIKAKLAKVENNNPWEKASADTERYEDELTDLIMKMNEAKDAAYKANVEGSGKSMLAKLEQEAVVAAAKVDETRAAMEQLQIQAAQKGMYNDALDIESGLMTDTDKAKFEYDRRSADAQAFFDNHRAQLMADSEAYAAYNQYRAALDAQYQRETESGLDEWIRQNKDATQQYKALWGSAMDRFNDLVVDGLTTGKASMTDFVTFVLKEFLRIQVAKAMAAAAEQTSGMGGWLSGLVSIGSAMMGGGAGGGNGMAAGSAGATSSNLGASAGGYSSSYFANGGIMTEYGQLALNKYANGGIAKTPQVAIYGEGKKPEAYVPLPDGRTIPVTMKGGGAGGSVNNMPVSISITVNKDGSETSESSDDALMNGLASKIKVLCMEVLLTETRPGGIIDRRK